MSKISMGSRVTRQLNERLIHWGLLNAKSPCLVQESSEPQIAVCSVDILGPTLCTCSVPNSFLGVYCCPLLEPGLCWYSLNWCPCFYVSKYFCELFHISPQERWEEERNQMTTQKGRWIEVTKLKEKKLVNIVILSHSPSITHLWCGERLHHFWIHCV